MSKYIPRKQETSTAQRVLAQDEALWRDEVLRYLGRIEKHLEIINEDTTENEDDELI